MSSGMRRVVRDNRPRPKLPSATTSKAAPRLFTNSSRRNNTTKQNNPKLYLPMYRNQDTDSNYTSASHSSKERKPSLMARTLHPTKDNDSNHSTSDNYHYHHSEQLPSNQEREVTIEFMDDYDDIHKASDIMSFQSVGHSMILKSRRSIHEIRKRHSINRLGKLLAMFLVGIVVLTESWNALTPRDAMPSSSKKMDQSIKDKTAYEKGPVTNNIQKDLLMKSSENDEANAGNKKEKTKEMTSAEQLIEKILNEESGKEDELERFKIYKSTTTISTEKEKKKIKEMKETTLKETPKLSGGMPNSFSIKTIPDLPETLGNVADISSQYNMENDKAFFWDIHLAGGTIVEHVFGKCLNLLQASEMGIQHDFDDALFDETLQVLEMDGQNYLNIDTTTEAGLERAKSLDILASPVSPSVFHSPLIHEMGSIFTPNHRGRMFALFRHPMERAVSMYYYLQGATWDPLYDTKISKISLQEYALSSLVENNWMTRFLVNKKGGKLTSSDLNIAKEIIRQKCLVGLFDKIEESMVRFEMYFGWRTKMTSKQKKCEKKLIKKGDDRHDHPMVEEGSSAWNALLQHNLYDMELYEYAKQVFKEQGKLKNKK